MLEKIDTSRTMRKAEFKERMNEMQPKLAMLQRKCKELNIPVMIVFEGFGASGKGAMIAKLIEPLDPRGFQVYTTQQATEEEKKHPFLSRFFVQIPAKGRIAIFDRSWYTKVTKERMNHLTTKNELRYAYDEINHFEKILSDDGMVIIKIFLHITKKEQKKRLEALSQDPSTAWRVTNADWTHNKHYQECIDIMDEMLEKTDQDYAPWTIVEAEDKYYAASKIYHIVMKRLEQECNGVEQMRNETIDESSLSKEEECFLNGVLNGIDLSKDMEKEQYKQQLDELQSKLASLQEKMFREEIPSVIVFEGWDAAGKGGAIKRLTQKLDPRGYKVVPIGAPDETERAHHYLWRFYQHLPVAGHLAVFDRSWYGRVMVERIEGYCTENEYRRAYGEINFFEEQLVNFGTVVIKFWLHIEEEEQEERFIKRQETPEKQWKITEEDWRNRSKWSEYETAVDEMILRTSTTYAPWIVVEANSKLYARIKVLQTIVKAYEDKLKEKKK